MDKRVSPKPMAWRMREAEFFEFCQPVGLKTWKFKDQQAWLGYSLEGTVLLLERSQANNPEGKKCGNSDLKMAWGTEGGDYLHFSECIPERQYSEIPLRNKVAGKHHFHPLPFSINTHTGRK